MTGNLPRGERRRRGIGNKNKKKVGPEKREK
jgi:hypothetical protein